jgi:hypothetical protein|tara:strand:+ start:686 stop:1837 length:1152 start_codon:yes stop_codon:yes gene_type:complete
MAVYKLFPIQDATVYSGYPSMNSGLDSLLEVTSEFPQTLTPSPRVARSLLKFDQNEIDDVIDNKIINANWSGSLKSYVSVAQGVNFNSTLKVYPISGSWYNGTGEYLDSPQTTNGVSWLYSNFKEGHLWEVDTNRPFVTSSYTTGNSGGTTFFTGSNNVNISSITGSQTFTPRSSRDLNIPVTDTIKIWHSASKSTDSGYIRVNNDGFILKWDDNIEFSPSQSIQPVIKFYSVDTNTIYPPTLEFKWDDFVYSTSLTEIATTDLFIGLDSNPGTFYSESVNRFRLNVRPEFPVRTFQTASLYTSNFALPSASYYAIKDLDTNEFVVDFDDNFTKISCDNTSNFFDVYMNGLEPERYYKILVKTTINGSIIVKDEDYYFKVING